MLKKLFWASLMAVLLLSGCGSTSETNTKKSDAKSSATMTPENQLAFYEDSLKNERVWLLVDTEEGVISKDSMVKEVMVTKDGKITTYEIDVWGEEYTRLSELKDKTADELKELGVEKDKFVFETALKNGITTETKYEVPRPLDIKPKLETDSTGNTVTNERIYVEKSDQDVLVIFSDIIPLQVFQIYDKYYAGYYEDDDYSFALITPSEEKYVNQIVTKLDDEK